MSASPSHDTAKDHENVGDLGEFLKETYRRAQEVDEGLHSLMSDLRARLVVLERAGNPRLAERIARAEDEIAAGDTSHILSAEEFAQRYVSQR